MNSKFIIILAFISLVFSNSNNLNAQCGPNGTFSIPKVCETPVIDGIEDKVWHMAPWAKIDGTKDFAIDAVPGDCRKAVEFHSNINVAINM